MCDVNQEIALTREQKAALFLQAQLLLALSCNARDNQKESELCYLIPVFPVGQPVC